jgi:hypothetical protein
MVTLSSQKTGSARSGRSQPFLGGREMQNGHVNTFVARRTNLRDHLQWLDTPLGRGGHKGTKKHEIERNHITNLLSTYPKMNCKEFFGYVENWRYAPVTQNLTSNPKNASQ